ncbi:MAG: hypothetical protein QXX20_03785 [Candidatus Thermoplasmatota archaeon]
MVIYSQGNETIYRDGQPVRSIIDIDFQNGLLVYAFPGILSANDIWIKFRDRRIPRTQIRTPKHIHWTVDLLIKKDNDAQLTNQFLNDMLQRWNNIHPLPDRTYQTILHNLILSQNQQFLSKYQQLNNHGFFNIDFLTHLMELLMLQEKTNNPNAYMFRNVVNAILNSQDLYGIISTATHR